MAKHSHRFVEDYQGFVGFGMDRTSDENTLIVYLQKISDDALAQVLVQRMTEEDRMGLFNLLGELLVRYLSEEEYHQLFLKEP